MINPAFLNGYHRSTTTSLPILWTDDDPSVLILGRMLLERQGFEVITSPDSREAISICQTRPLACVISDIMKPEVNGLELLRILRSGPLTAELPFMFVTSRGWQEVREEAAELGVSEIIVKPFTAADIVGSLQRLGISKNG